MADFEPREAPRFVPPPPGVFPPPTRSPFPGALYALTQLASWVSLTPGLLPLPLRLLATLLVSAVYVYIVFGTTTGDLGGDLGLGSAILSQMLVVWDFGVFGNVGDLRDVYREAKSGGRGGGGGERGGKVEERPLKERLIWIANLAAGARGIGWSYEPPNLPPRPHPSTPRSTFVITQLLRAVGYISLEIVLTIVNASNPALTSYTSSQPLLISEHWGIWSPERLLGCAGFAVAGYARISAMYCVLGAGIVGMGFSKPERWPDLFGRWRDVWSVQRVWRRFWHQLLRKSVTGTTTFILERILRIRLSPSSHSWSHSNSHSRSPSNLSSPSHSAGTSLSKTSPLNRKPLPWHINLVRIQIVFTIVALLHVGGEYMLLGHMYPRGTWTKGTFWFFWSQWVGIAFESCVRWLWRRWGSGSGYGSSGISHGAKARGLEKGHGNGNGNGYYGHKVDDAENLKELEYEEEPVLWKRVLGYVWVMTWISWTLPYMLDPLTTVGFFTNPKFDLRTNGWVPGGYSVLGV